MPAKVIEVHPNILERNGKKEFAILPYEEFESIMDALADYEDLRELLNAKASVDKEPGIPLSEVRKQLGI